MQHTSTHRRRVAGVIAGIAMAAILLVEVVPAALALGPFTGDLAASATTQNGTVTLAASSTCVTAGSPGTAASGMPKFTSFTFANDTGADSCATVAYTAATNVMVAAYTGSFDPSNPTVNFAGAPATSGSCGGTSGGFTFRVNAGQSYVIVVSECTPGSGGTFSFTVALAPRTLTIDANVTADATTVPAGSQGGFTINLINGGEIAFESVVWTDALPGGPGIDWTLASDSSAGWAITGTAPNQSLTFPGDFVAPSTTTTAHVVTNTTTASCGTYTNAFDVTVMGELTQGSASDSDSFVVTACDASSEPPSLPPSAPASEPPSLPPSAPASVAPSLPPSAPASVAPSMESSPLTSHSPGDSATAGTSAGATVAPTAAVGDTQASAPATDTATPTTMGGDRSAAVTVLIALAVSCAAVIVGTASRPQTRRRE